MNRESRPRGDGSSPIERTATKYRQASGKNFVQKKKRSLTKHELEEWNALVKQKAPTHESDGREAELERLGDFELCWDLAGKFARESANRTCDVIADIRDRYEAITLGFRCARVAQSSEAPLALRGALNALAEEFQRDRQGLLRFLDAAFERWERIDQPGSLFQMRSVTQQHLGKPHVVAQYLENTGAVSNCSTLAQRESLRATIRQYRSRDRRSALKRRKSL
jgi:hypothetical protein